MNRLARCATSCVAIALLLTSAPFFTDRAGVVAEAQAPADISLQPRVEDISSLVWQGSFQVPADFFGSDVGCGGTSCATFAYGGTSLGFNNESLFIVGHDQGQLVTEVGIPALNKGPAVGNLPMGGLLQLFADPTEGRMESANPGSGTNKKIGGLFVHDNKLYSTVYDFYDGANTQVASHFVSGTNLSVLNDVAGPQRVKYCIGDTDCLNAGFFDGYFAKVPAEWQSALGGPVLNGNCCLNVINRTSWGPAAFTIDPAQLGHADADGALPEVTANALVYYFSDGSTPADNTGNFHPLVEDVLRPADPPYFGGDDACHNTSALFNCSSEVRGVVFPQGTRSVLFFGRQGLGSICYGQGTNDRALHGELVDPVNEPDVNYCYDPADHNKGFHAWPYAHYVWGYDANDLKAVRDGAVAPWDVKPYKVWRLPLPLDTPFGTADDTQNRRIGGAAYDPATGRIFLSQVFDDGRAPLIHVFKLDVGGTPPPAPTPVAAALTSPAPGSTFASRAQLFAWNAGLLVTRYKIDVGSAPGGSDLFAGTLGTALQQLVTGLPSDGRAIHVRLSSEIGGALQSTDYAFVAYRNHAPVVQPIDPLSATVGDSVSVQVLASDVDGDTLTYTAAGHPASLSINESTGRITGTASAAGDFDIIVTVSDGELSAQQLFRLHVEDVAPPPPPPANRLVNPGAQVNDEGDKVDFEIDVVPAVQKRRGGDDNRAVFRAVNLPGGLQFDRQKGRIHGHIANDAANGSPYNVAITLTEGSESWSIAFDWTVRAAGRGKSGNSGKGGGRD